MKKVTFFAIGLIVFFAAAVPLFAQDGREIGLRELLPVHIALMSLAGAGMLGASLLARYGKGNVKHWFQWHKRIQWGSAVSATLGVIVAVIMVEITTGIHLRVAHSIVAVVSFGLMVLAIIAAYGFLRRRHHKKELRIMHRRLGRIAVLTWLVVIVLGLFTPLAGIF